MCKNKWWKDVSNALSTGGSATAALSVKKSIFRWECFILSVGMI